jgi:hypothetical protein
MPMQRDTPRRINPDEAPSWRQGGGKNQCLVGGQITGDGLLVKTVGSYWPDAITLFDFTRRAMTWTAPKSLTNHEVYAVTAHILRLNGKCRSRGKPDFDAAQLAQPLMRLCPRRATSLFDRVGKVAARAGARYRQLQQASLPTLPAPFWTMPFPTCIAALTQTASRKNRNRYAVVRMQHIVPRPAI